MIHNSLLGKNLVSVADLTTEEVQYLLRLSYDLKYQKKSGVDQRGLLGNRSKTIAVIMQKDSTRTRSAFETAAFDLGMNVSYIGPSGSQMGKKESMKDTARVLSRYYDGIAFRCNSHQDFLDLANNATVPCWNALSDIYHPTQMFADFLSVMENFKRTDIKFAYFGDACNNMGNSLLLMAAHCGTEFWGVAPKKYWPNAEIINKAKEIAKTTGASINFTEDINEGAKDAQVIYTDVWVSMGEPADVWKQRIDDLAPYQVNAKVMSLSAKDSIFLHCLPAFHDKNTVIGKEIASKYKMDALEVTDEVFESTKSKVMDQAENRAHTIKAIMLATLGH